MGSLKCIPSYYTCVPWLNILVSVFKDTCKDHSRLRLGLLCNPKTIDSLRASLFVPFQVLVLQSLIFALYVQVVESAI